MLATPRFRWILAIGQTWLASLLLLTGKYQYTFLVFREGHWIGLTPADELNYMFLNFPALLISYPLRLSAAAGMLSFLFGGVLLEGADIIFLLAVFVFWFWAGAQLDRHLGSHGPPPPTSSRAFRGSMLLLIMMFFLLWLAAVVRDFTDEKHVGFSLEYSWPQLLSTSLWSLLLLYYLGKQFVRLLRAQGPNPN